MCYFLLILEIKIKENTFKAKLLVDINYFNAVVFSFLCAASISMQVCLYICLHHSLHSSSQSDRGMSCTIWHFCMHNHALTETC